ncbi:MAG: DUF222 domain-containing protein [Micrococcales bacterium]|nr:DUF222 domain-containing protein [Micrococcales bacterium]
MQQLTGVSARDARQLVVVGGLEQTSPVGASVREGELTVAQASAIRAGLGEPSGRVTAEQLATASKALIPLAATVSVEELRARARELRDELDAAGIVDREAELRERRYLHLYPHEDGMTRLVGLLDPESAALVQAAVDAGTSPRRGGPRVTTVEGTARAERIIEDPRSTDQLALDTVLAVLHAGTTADPGVLGPVGAPVQVLVTERDLIAGAGPARIEGQTAAVSIDTARRRACADGITPILLDPSGRRVLNLGRTQRLFSTHQRRAITARDGGCLIPGCPSPPSWCEAHHIREWSRGGSTDVDDGVLLCRFHHLWLHNTGRRIDRDSGGYRLLPPPDIDPIQRPQRLPSKNPLLRRLTG